MQLSMVWGRDAIEWMILKTMHKKGYFFSDNFCPKQVAVVQCLACWTHTPAIWIQIADGTLPTASEMIMLSKHFWASFHVGHARRRKPVMNHRITYESLQGVSYYYTPPNFLLEIRVIIKIESNPYYPRHPYMGHPSISKKNPIKSMLFSISMRKTESPSESIFFLTFLDLR